MNTNDIVNKLFESGVYNIAIGKPPPEKASAAFYVQADQFVPTGAQGNNMKIIHQAAGDCFTDCLNQIIKEVEAANERKAEPLVVVPRNGR